MTKNIAVVGVLTVIIAVIIINLISYNATTGMQDADKSETPEIAATENNLDEPSKLNPKLSFPRAVPQKPLKPEVVELDPKGELNLEDDEKPEIRKWIVEDMLEIEELLEVLEYVEDNDFEEIVFDDEIKFLRDLIDWREELTRRSEINARDGVSNPPDLEDEFFEMEEREKTVFEDMTSRQVLRKYFTFPENQD